MKNTCLIIGGGTGMGLGLAMKFGREGYTIGFISRRKKIIDIVGNEVKKTNSQFYGYEIDITNFDELKKGILDFYSINNSLSIVIYNAAGFGNGNALNQNPLDFINDLKVSLGGFLVTIQTCEPLFTLDKKSTLLATGGGFANTPSFDFISLGVGKTALEYIVKSIAPEFSKRHIHVAVVTIRGSIKENTYFSPDKISDVYWRLHNETNGSFTINQDYA